MGNDDGAAVDPTQARRLEIAALKAGVDNAFKKVVPPPPVPPRQLPATRPAAATRPRSTDHGASETPAAPPATNVYSADHVLQMAAAMFGDSATEPFDEVRGP